MNNGDLMEIKNFSTEEVETDTEKKTDQIPLETIKLLEEVVKKLNLSMRNITLYPSNHPTILPSMNSLRVSIDCLLETKDSFTLGISKDKILIDGKSSFKNSEILSNFAQDLHKLRIATITFHKGLETEEIRNFIEIITTDPKLFSEGSVVKTISESKISHISATEIDYQKILRPGEDISEEKSEEEREEEIWKSLINNLTDEVSEFSEKESNLLFKIVENPEKINNLIEKVIGSSEGTKEEKTSFVSSQAKMALRIMQKLGNNPAFTSAENQSTLKENLAKVYSDFPPELRFMIAETKLPLARGEVDIIESISPELSSSTISEIVAVALADRGMSTKKIAKVFSRLSPNTSERGQILPMIKQKLRKTEIGGQGYSLEVWQSIEKIFLEKSEEDFMSPMYQETLDDLSSEEPSTKEIAEPEELKIYLKSIKEEKIHERTIAVLLNLLELETNLEEYRELAVNIKEKTKDLLFSKQYESVEQILDMFSKHISPDGNRPVEQQDCAKEIMESLVDAEMIKNLINSLYDPNKQKAATTTLLQIGKKAVEPLIETLIQEEERLKRRIIVNTLISIGGFATSELVKKLSDGRWYVIRNMLTILAEIKDKTTVTHISSVITHTELRVRKEAVRALTKIGGPQANKFLLTTLNDPEEEIVHLTARYLGSIKDTQAVPMLLKIIRKRNFWGQNNQSIKRAIKALGDIGAKESVPSLIKLFKKNVWFVKEKHDEIKVASASALKQIGTSEAIKTLITGTKSRRKTVRYACEKLLNEGKIQADI